MHVPAILIVAAFLASSEEAEARAPAPHPLVTAVELLYQRALPWECDELLKFSSMIRGLTNEDRMRLKFVEALRGLEDGDDSAARRALEEALQIDPAARPPPFASQGLLSLLEATRAGGSGTAPPGQAASGQRTPSVQVLLRAVDALYTGLQIESAGAVLDLVRAAVPMTAPERAQVALREGILRMESGDEVGARAAFREALLADGTARLPDYAPPKTLRVYANIDRSARSPWPLAEVPPSDVATSDAATKPSAPQPRPLNAMQTWGLVLGGTGLASVLAGAVAGALALLNYRVEQEAAAAGAWETYAISRSAAITAVDVADKLYITGAVFLSLGTALFVRGSSNLKLVAGAGHEHASLAIEGRF